MEKLREDYRRGDCNCSRDVSLLVGVMLGRIGGRRRVMRREKNNGPLDWYHVGDRLLMDLMNVMRM